MKKKVDIFLNIATIILIGVLIIIQLLTEVQPIILIVWGILFVLQIVALILRLSKRDKN